MILYLVVPCFNEQEILEVTAQKLLDKINCLNKKNIISEKSRILFVDDGSTDNTWSIIKKLHEKNKFFSGLKLSRNKGHQNALIAGLMAAKEKCDAAISLDADLQDDINAVDKMCEKFLNENCDIVYGVRSARNKDSFFKKHTAEAYYKLLSRIGVEVTYNHADFRLMSKRAIEALESFREVNLFLRGIVPMIGFKSDKVYYERQERTAGSSKYPLGKMISFALEGITSLSIKPIRFITALGIGIFVMSIIMLIYFIILHYVKGVVPGWTTIVVSVWAIGGLQLLSIGIIGEYIGKIYLETKKRPKYFIDEYLE